MKKGIVIALILLPFNSFAASVSHQDSIGPVLFWITLLLFFGVLGRLIAKRLKQPGVLGELLMGVILGNLCYYFGVELMALLREGPSIFAIVTHLLTKESLPVAVQKVIPNATDALQVLHVLSAEKGSDLLRVAYIVNIFSSYGIIFLLFVTGLENSLSDLKSTGRSSMQVACIGVVAPICLGFFAMRWFFPEYSINTGIFIAATLCATSIGISAEVLKDLKILHSKEAKTILGAAMIDDILGLIVLAIVSSLVVNGIVHYGAVLYIVVATLLFFLVSIVVGPWILRQSTRFFKTLDPWEEKLFVSFLFFLACNSVSSVLNYRSIYCWYHYS